MTDYQGAIPIWTTQCYPDRAGHKAQWLIVHGTAGFTSPDDVAHYFQTVQASTHYVVGRDGRVVQCVPESKAAWGNGIINGTPGRATLDPNTGYSINRVRDAWWTPAINPNYQTISIEHVKNDDRNAQHLTSAQQAASFALIHDICQRNGIPMRPADANGGITGHFSIEAVDRSECPGPYPWSDLWAFLQNGGVHMLDIHGADVSTYYDVIDSTHLKCKSTGHVIQFGILSFYLRYGGDALCGLTYLGLPLTDEQAVPGKTNCVIQHFERGVVAYDPQKQLDNPPNAGDVYLMHADAKPAPAPAPQPSGNEQHYRDLLTQIEQGAMQLATLAKI